MTTVVDTKLGCFEVRDDRGSDPRDVARVWPVDLLGEQTTVKINNKPYKGPFTLTRQVYNQEYRHVRAWYGELTDSARAKLLDALGDVWGMYPVLTHAEKIPKVLAEVRHDVRNVLDRHLKDPGNEVLRRWNMTQYENHRGNDGERDPVTDEELAAVAQAIRDEAAAWLSEGGYLGTIQAPRRRVNNWTGP